MGALRQVLRITSPLHARLYRAFGGRGLDRLAADRMPVLLLTTVGRRSQQRRTVPVGFARDRDDLIVMGSNGGQPQPPGWVFNLQAQPQAEVEIGRQHLRVQAEWPTGDERERLWALVVRDYPVFNGYQRKTARPIPVIRLRVLGASQPPQRG